MQSDTVCSFVTGVICLLSFGTATKLAHGRHRQRFSVNESLAPEPTDGLAVREEDSGAHKLPELRTTTLKLSGQASHCPSGTIPFVDPITGQPNFCKLDGTLDCPGSLTCSHHVVEDWQGHPLHVCCTAEDHSAAKLCANGEPHINPVTLYVETCRPGDGAFACDSPAQCEFAEKINQHICCAPESSCKGGWNYEVAGPSEWPSFCPSCSGKRQSPITFWSEALSYQPNTAPVIFHGYRSKLSHLPLINNGHTAQINLAQPTKIGIEIAANPGALYLLQQVHFHWGVNNWGGSEHSIEGYEYPLEIHFVHKFDETHLAVLAVFAEINCTTEDAEITEVYDSISNIFHAEAKSTLTGKFILDDLLPKDRSLFFAYPGSLTTPPCAEIVDWTVFKNTVPVHPETLTKLRMIRDPEERKINGNHRQLQAVNNRQIIYTGSTPPTPPRRPMLHCRSAKIFHHRTH